MAATGQRPDVFQTPASHAQFVVVPTQDTRIASLATPVALPGWPRTGFYQRRGKRIFDLVVGTALLLALSPLLLIVAVTVLVTSGWPIFYGSERIGQDGRRFQMWKFRTMVRDADAVFERWKETHSERAMHLLTHWRLEADLRVTVLGRFLRKSSLDELPQFWNVLCGEMSIAGPAAIPLARSGRSGALARDYVRPARAHGPVPGVRAAGPFPSGKDADGGRLRGGCAADEGHRLHDSDR